MSRNARIIKNILFVVVLAALGYIFRDTITSAFVLLRQDYFPCSAPIKYSIGTFDTKFGISREEFLADLKAAENLWENAAHKNLFEYSLGGSLKVNLVYDYRQQVTEKLNDLGIVVETNQNSYNELKAKHDALEAKYAEQKLVYESRLKTFEKNKSDYEQEVSYWNNHGGASKDEYNKLQQEEANLKAEASELKTLQASLNTLVDQINALVVVLNEQAKRFNITAGEYNKVGQTLGEEFQEGLYTRNRLEQKIDIFEFSDKQKLIRVLAHELGHALSLEHVSDPKAIMYKLNQGENDKLTEADIAALKTKCNL